MYNIPVQTNVYNTIKEQPKDLKGNSCYVERHITPQKKAGVWNMPLEYFNKYSCNQATVVKENEFLENQKPNQKQRNFADKELKNLDDYLDTMIYRQIEDYYKNVPSAYNKGKKETFKKQEKQQELKKSRKGEIMPEKILNNVSIVRERVKEYLRAKQIDFQEKNRRNQAEIQRLYRTMKEAVQHILAGEGEAKFNRMQQQLQEKEHINCEFLKEKEKKLTDSKNVLTQKENLRLLVSKRTDEFEVLKQIHGEDFLTNTTLLKDISDSGKTGDTGSVVSESMARYENEVQKQMQEDPRLAKLYNISDLKLKWGYESDKQVKDSIRRILVRQTLSEAEHKKARQDREEQEMRQKIIRQDPSMKFLFQAEDKNKKKQKKQLEQKMRQREQEKEDRRKRLFATTKNQDYEDEEQQDQVLNAQQAFEGKVKNNFFNLSTNALVSKGEVFNRTKDYSQLFKNRAMEQYNPLQFQENPEKIQDYVQATYS